MQFDTVSRVENLPRVDLLVGFTGSELTGDTGHSGLDGALSQFAESVELERAGAPRLTAVDDLPAEAVLLHSPEFTEDENDAEALRQLANGVIEACREQGFTSVAIVLGGSRSDEAARRLVEGLQLAAYGYSEFTDKNDDLREGLEIYFAGTGDSALADLDRTRQIYDAVNRARDINNRPANELYPQSFVEYAEELVEGTGLEVTVKDEQQLAEEDRNGIIAVGQASSKPPRLLHLQWGDDPEVALLGKGVTFDTGGVSIKSSAGMWDMRSDMSGAGAVLHAAWALAELDCPVSFHAVCVLAENMVSGGATRPGDVIEYRNGLTVEIRNTDAEGRLMLADGLIYLQEQGAETILESSTLTGSVIRALGHRYSGVTTRYDELWERVREISERTGDLVWRLPMPKEYEGKLKASHADVSNIPGDRNAGATTAGLFLNNFVEDETRFVHNDIASAAFHDPRGAYTKPGCTGHGVRLYTEFIESFAE